MKHPTRRAFIAATTLAAVTNVNAAGRPIRLGGPVFTKSIDPVEVAQEHRRLGYSAAYCPEVKLSDTDRIRAIEKAFAEANVLIAEVGAWKNMLDPVATKRRENLAYVVERCALAEAVGARCCVDIAGSYNPTVWYGPDPKNVSKEFFEATVENCRHIIDSVKPKRTKFTVEMMGWNLPDGPDSYVQLIKAVDRPAFGVHLDICNGINCPQRFYQNSVYTKECFQKLGQQIVSCHAKDLQWIPEMNIHFLEVIPGRGQVDYHAYLQGLAQLSFDAPLMLEHLKTAEEYEEGKQYILRIGRENGITFA
ncbi:MAG: sugar phosphate isomerase/epimerase [Bryobacteraceae bacterium]